MSAELHTVPPTREWRWWSRDAHYGFCNICGCSLLWHRHRAAHHCFDCCEVMRPHQIRAINAVGAAVKRGDLPKLDGSIQCTDCKRPANRYDHRDYAKPLDVEPVCQNCNFKRGTAEFPGRDKLRANARVAELQQRVSA